MKENKRKLVVLPQGKCSTIYCSECTYFCAYKVSFGRCYCSYYKQYSRRGSDIACAHFVRG